eukprot:TRINITY_DN1613_c0_g1_i1.p1 TRINITY_DN1613_c0_g1~~TRINITY_DN1613_c0_g1_i1.p1  ORF type:complete len:241 (-),score=37.03 TRINITY_DN1613_c0_g1_i1:45-713(-)
MFLKYNLLTTLSQSSYTNKKTQHNRITKRHSEMKVYTKTGDKGTTSLYTGERRPKIDLTFDALGTTDELNAHLGLAKEFCLDYHIPLDEKIVEIQSRLLDVGSHIATPRASERASERKIHLTAFNPENVELLEDWIDEMDMELPPLTNFILPGGGKASAQLHICRTVCRRAERAVLQVKEENDICESVTKYLNRLSDFLFVSARYACLKESQEEVIYKKIRN